MEELTTLNRANWNLAWDLIAPFRKALEIGPFSHERASKSLDKLNLEDSFSRHPELRECSRCPELLDAYGSGGLDQAVRVATGEDIGKIIDRGVIAEAVAMPYQVSDSSSLKILERFWTFAFQSLPILPVALTISRSPFFSPAETVRLQECLLLGLAMNVWPSVAPIRMGQHITTWHHSCNTTDSSNAIDWPTSVVGRFEGQKSSDELWQLAVPEGVLQMFAAVSDDVREVRFVNPNHEQIEYCGADQGATFYKVRCLRGNTSLSSLTRTIHLWLVAFGSLQVVSSVM